MYEANDKEQCNESVQFTLQNEWDQRDGWMP